MNEELAGPYRKLEAVQEQQEAAFLVEVFSSHWKLKFKSMPIFPVSNYHFTQMKEFRKSAKAAGANAEALIEHYFSIRDEWFEKQAYSLDCLCKNVNKVNASYGKAKHSQDRSNKIRITRFCDCCEVPMELELPLDFDFNALLRCEDCKNGNKPPKKTTKAERMTKIVKFGEGILNLKEKT